jgi:hypothetical protein
MTSCEEIREMEKKEVEEIQSEEVELRKVILFYDGKNVKYNLSNLYAGLPSTP